MHAQQCFVCYKKLREPFQADYTSLLTRPFPVLFLQIVQQNTLFVSHL